MFLVLIYQLFKQSLKVWIYFVIQIIKVSFTHFYYRLNYLFTVVANSEPGLNLGRFFAFICIAFPVWGLRPIRALDSCTENVPKPINVTFSPFFSVSFMVLKITSNVSFTSFWLLPVFLATASTNSFLFIMDKF